MEREDKAWRGSDNDEYKKRPTDDQRTQRIERDKDTQREREQPSNSPNPGKDDTKGWGR